MPNKAKSEGDQDPLPLPPPPTRQQPASSWPHFELYQNVKDAISTLPARFRTETYIAGVNATDIHTLNTVLGAAIEEQVVLTLNAMRSVWDPDEKYSLYHFIRQAQTFPDVLLRRASDAAAREGDSPQENILLGIELKGWYLLAKEGEPSLRYKVTRSACNPQDLVVVVPWALSQVISGSPIVFDPYIEVAGYAADFRNYYWQHLRKTKKPRGITQPPGIGPYPVKSDSINDVPDYDGGDNFGRLARSQIMNDYMARMMTLRLSGVQIDYWLSFICAFTESNSENQVRQEIETLTNKIRRSSVEISETGAAILAIIEQLRRLVGNPTGEDSPRRGRTS